MDVQVMLMEGNIWVGNAGKAVLISSGCTGNADGKEINEMFICFLG